MGIAGPRLDRPSAVGDEGRPRAASQTIAALVAVGLAVALGLVWGAPGLVTLLGIAVGLFVGGLGLLTRATVGSQVVGSLLYHLGAIAVVAVLLAALAGSSQVLAVGGLFVALLGTGATWANVFARDRLETAMRSAATSYLAVIGWLLAFGFILALYGATRYVVAAVLGAASPAQSLFGGLALLTAAGLLVRGACSAVPVAALSPRDRRERDVAVVDGVAFGGTVLAGGAVATIVLAAIYGQGRIDALGAANPTLDAVLAAFSAPPVVLSIVAVGVVAGLVAALGAGTRAVATQLDAGNDDLLAGALAGLLLATVVFSLTLIDLPLGGLVAVDLLVGFGLIAPVLTIVAGFVAVAAIDTGVVPARAAGPALTAVGLLWAGVGAALAGVPAPLVFACVAGAMVAWDCGTFGLGLTVELGHRPETRRLELYHGVLSVGVGIATVVAATAVDHLHGVAGGAVGTWPAVALAVLGAVLLAAAIHRRGGV